MFRESRLPALLGIICLIVGVIAPFFTISVYGLSTNIGLTMFWEGDVMIGAITVITIFVFKDFIISIIPSLNDSTTGDKIRNLSPKIGALFTAIAAGLVIFLLIDNKKSIDIEYVHFGWGFYVFWVGILLLLIHGLVYDNLDNYKPAREVSQVSDSPQNNVPNVQLNVTTTIAPNAMDGNYQNQTEVHQNIQPNNPIICPKCGAKNEFNAIVCVRCAYNFNSSNETQNN